MTREDVFRDLVDLIDSYGRDLDTSRLALDDVPFSAHGIDSLTMVRLVGGVEKRYDIELKDSDALVAYSFDRLVDLILDRLGLSAAERRAGSAGARVNFLDALHRSAAPAGDRAEIRRRVLRQDDVALPQVKLLRIAARIGQDLPDPVDGRPPVALVAATDPLVTLTGFLAALSVEALPLILPPPKAIGGQAAYLDRIGRLARTFGNRPALLLEPGILPQTAALPDLPVVDLPPDVDAAPALDALPATTLRSRGGDDVAFLQMTSASTGDAKLVAITHANICANLEAMAANLTLKVGEDQACGWMPLHHDMGLVGATLFPMYTGFSAILMRPNDFIKNPALWLRTLSEFRVTFTGAPNFALDYAAMAVSDGDLDGVDLSGLRRFGLAAEPIHRTSVQHWLDRFGPYGFRPDAFVPGLGLAESTLSSTTRPGRAPRYAVVETTGTVIGEPVGVLGRGVCTHPAGPAPEPSEGVAVLSLGTALDGLSVYLCDEQGARQEGEHLVGEVCLVGSSVAGYYDPASGTQTGFPQGVLRTGDLGFFDEGELFVLERLKNVVIRNGVNHIVSLLEQQVADIFGILAHGVAILDEDVHDPESPVHAVIEMANSLEGPAPDQRTALRALQLPVDIVTLVRGVSLPRTTSGKKRYHACRQMLSTGEFDVVRQVDLR